MARGKAHLEISHELASMGCRADFVQGTVLNFDDVTRTMNWANSRLKGVFQMSMVLHDNNFVNMTKGEWDSAVDPKVKGTWILHNASNAINAARDFFVLFSSLIGIISQPGQTNCTGANTFMDAYAQHPLNLGLPACVIQIGEEVRYVMKTSRSCSGLPIPLAQRVRS